jgi:hypothetical protein
VTDENEDVEQDTAEDVLKQVRTSLLDLIEGAQAVIERIEQVSPPGRTWRGKVRSGAVRKGDAGSDR